MLGVALFSLLIVFQLSLVSAKQQETHISMWRLSYLHITIISKLFYRTTYLLIYLLTYLCTYIRIYVHTYLRTYLRTYLLNYVLTHFNRVLLEKRIVYQLVKNFPSFYGTQNFITAFTSARHLSLSSASPCSPSYFLKLRLNITLQSMVGSCK